MGKYGPAVRPTVASKGLVDGVDAFDDPDLSWATPAITFDHDPLAGLLDAEGQLPHSWLADAWAQPGIETPDAETGPSPISTPMTDDASLASYPDDMSTNDLELASYPDDPSIGDLELASYPDDVGAGDSELATYPDDELLAEPSETTASVESLEGEPDVASAVDAAEADAVDEATASTLGGDASQAAADPSPADTGTASGTDEATTVDETAAPEASGMTHWRTNVRSARASRLATPARRSSEPATTAVRQAGRSQSRREAGRRQRAPSEAETVVPTPPAMPDGIETSPDHPVPAVKTTVDAAVGKKLTDQPLPPVASYFELASGESHRPTVNVAPVSTSRTQLKPPQPRVPGQAVEGQDAVNAVRDADQNIEGAREGDGSLVLGSAPAPDASNPPAHPLTKTTVTKVLGQLQATAADDASEILTDIRKNTYPKDSLHQEYGDLGEPALRMTIEQRIRESVATMRNEAGIEASAVDAEAATVRATLDEQSGENMSSIDTAHSETAENMTCEADASSGALAGARELADERAAARAAAAEGGSDPASIRARRDALVASSHRVLARADIHYERDGADRQRELAAAQRAYESAYIKLGSDLTPQPPSPMVLRPPVDGAPPERPVAPTDPQQNRPASPAEQWANAQLTTLRDRFGDLKFEASEETRKQRKGIETAVKRVRDQLDDWAEREIGERSSFWERLWDQIKSWRADATNQTEAWEAARQEMLLSDMQDDVAFLGELTSSRQALEGLQAQAQNGSLNEAQLAIVTTYFRDPNGGNQFAAIAAGMRVHTKQALKPRIREELESLLRAKPNEEWNKVQFVANSEGNGVNVRQRGAQFHRAVDQWGTDEDQVYAALRGLSPLQRHALDMWYQAEHHTTIDAELRDELSGSELQRARDLMRGDELAADAAAIHRAVTKWGGTDEDAIWRALRGKDPEQRAELERIYRERYNQSLEDALKGDLSGRELARGQALRVGDTARADAIAIEHSLTSTWTGSADTDELRAVYEQNRSEVLAEAQRRGWTSERANREIAKRNREIESQHGVEFGGNRSGDNSSLRTSFGRHLSGPALDLAMGSAENDFARIDAARLELERRSFVTSDDVVNEVLEGQFKRAQGEVRLDQEHDLTERRDLARMRGEEWDERAQRRAMGGRIDDLAQERSRGYMAALNKRFDSEYSRWGSGGIHAMIIFNTSGNEESRALDLLRQGGRIEPEQEIFYAVNGAGTDVDVLRRLTANKTPDEIRKLEEAWAKRYPKEPPLRERIMDDVSGRDEFDLGMSLDGIPENETPQQRLARQRKRLEYEQTAYAFGNLWSGAEREDLEREVAELEATVRELEAIEASTANEDLAMSMPLSRADQERAAYLRWQIQERDQNIDAAVDEHRRSIDTVADQASMVAAVLAAVVVIAVAGVITFFTGGAGSPALIGAIAAASSALATIGTKAALKGSAYTEEEMLVDAVTGVVDVVLAVSTAGMGNALMRVADGVPIGPLAKLATSSSAAKRLAAKGIAEATEGFVTSLPSSFAGSIVDEKTWSNGDPLTNIAMTTGIGTLAGTGMSVGMAGGMGVASRAARHLDLPFMPRLDAGSPPDLDAAAAAFDQRMAGIDFDPQSRAASWHAHKTKNPSATYDDFLADLSAGRVKVDDISPAQFDDAMRDQLLASIPPGQRAALRNTPIEIVSDADFVRFSRSSSGQAVTIIDNGRPKILLRESADIRVLREEGFHAHQIVDPKNAALVKVLDEANMAKWDDLPLAQRMEMYRAKLELEVDANRQVLSDMRTQLDDMQPGPARLAFADQVGAAERTMRNLLDRQVEFGNFGLIDRIRARNGVGPLARRLDQAPRLFNKAQTVPVNTGQQTPDPDALTAQRAEPPPKTLPSGKFQTLGATNRSPLEGPEVEVYQVGDIWFKQSKTRSGPQRQSGDGHRLVCVVDKDGSYSYHRETFTRESVDPANPRRTPPQWVRWGGETKAKSLVGEWSAAAEVQAGVGQSVPAGTQVVNLGGAHQTRSGHGFDDVYFVFGAKGKIEIVLPDAKHYAGHVDADEFTAITSSLAKNIDRLQQMLDPHMPVHMLPESIRNLPAAQREAIRNAVNDMATIRGTFDDPHIERVAGNVRFEARLTDPHTHIGTKGKARPGRKGPSFKRLTSKLRRILGRRPRLKISRIGEKFVEAAEAVVEARRALPSGTSANVVEDPVRQVHMFKKLFADGMMSPPVAGIVGGDGAFMTKINGVDTAARTMHVADRLSTSGSVPKQHIDAEAQRIVDALAPVNLPSGQKANPPKVFVDLRGLGPSERLELQRHVSRLMSNGPNPANIRHIEYFES